MVSTLGILDYADYNVTGKNLVDLLEDKGISWKAYMENYPANCYQYSFGPGNDSYTRKHNPFISMVNIHDDPVRCAKIVNASQLDTDISTNAFQNLPITHQIRTMMLMIPTSRLQ